MTNECGLATMLIFLIKLQRLEHRLPLSPMGDIQVKVGLRQAYLTADGTGSVFGPTDARGGEKRHVMVRRVYVRVPDPVRSLRASPVAPHWFGWVF